MANTRKQQRKQQRKNTRKQQRKQQRRGTRKQNGAGFFDYFRRSPAPAMAPMPSMNVAMKNMPMNSAPVAAAPVPATAAPTRSWRNRIRGAYGNMKTHLGAVRNGFRSNTFRAALNQM
jgi:hypothetical protein